MNSLCIVGTDIATFFVYEPDALQHRAQSPWCWFADWAADGTNLAEVTVPERSDGRLVEIDTAIPLWFEDREGPVWMGSDGVYSFRCTTGPLTPDEAAREYPETRERYGSQVLHVTQGRILLDGGYVIPFDHTPATDGRSAGVSSPQFDITQAVKKNLAAWLVLPNGTYEVTPHYIRAAPEKDAAGEGDDAMIVLTFARLAS